MATYYWIGGNGTWDNTTKTNWAIVSGGAGGNGPPTSGDTVNFDANSGTGTCTTASTAACNNLVFNTATVTLTFGANFSIGDLFTLTQGAINMAGYTFNAGRISSNNSNTRSIAFGSGAINLNASGTTMLNFSTATGFSYTGTPIVNLTYSGAAGTRTISFGNTAGASETNSLTINVTAGTDTVSFNSGSKVKNVSFTGFSGTLSGAGISIYGNATYSSGMTITNTANQTYAGTSGTQQITTNGKTLDFPLTFNGVGGTFAFQDALTQGSTRAFTITNGTVQMKDGVTSTVGALATSGTDQKVLRSTSAGSQATLSQASGNFNAQYLTVKDIAATGGAKFNGLNNCVTQGNNSGWYFASQLGRPIPSFAF